MSMNGSLLPTRISLNMTIKVTFSFAHLIIDMENDRRKQPLKYIVAFCIALTTVYAKEIV